jgi:valyl-tRNA synthetase
VPPDRLEILRERTRYAPGEVEARVFSRWERAGIFHPEPEGSAESFSIAVPPPNVTGALHMGHALNGTVQDALVRLNRMRGRRTKWIFGTDHAGIATQVQVERQLAEEGTSRHELGREAFVERVWRWRERYGGTIVEQFKRLGASLDYDDERFTMDDDYAHAVAHVFVRLFEKGLIYRDNYLVNWDPGTRSAISDLEVEMREMRDTLYSIDYPLESGSGSITVATVRPETMLADTAIAVNPDDERYTRLVGESAILPLVGRRLRIIADPYVDPAFGTGALKITPGHDPNDFELGRAHRLEEITAIGEDGRMTEAAGRRFAGLPVDEAREGVVAALREEGLISGTQPYVHDVPHSQRSGRRIEPLISLQWFCDMGALAPPAIAAVREGRVRFHPTKPWTGVYLDWLEKIKPWCISRQLWWGHQLPVWYCDECEETYVAEPSQPPERCGLCGDELRRDPDVLDTWFSSALWPFATLGWPRETPELEAFYPTDVLSTARDIIFLWVARMIMFGIEFTGREPFADVPIHSVIQAPDGRRMSKSLGTGVDPLSEIEAYGADAVRFGLLAMASSQDVRYSADRVAQGRDLANKLWNASRLILLQAGEALADAAPPPAGDAPPPAARAPEDRWIVSRVEAAGERIGALVERFELSRAARELYAFVWGEVCDWYLELVKPRLYEGAPDRRGAAEMALWVLRRVLVLAHPMLPFVTEEVWSFVPGSTSGACSPSSRGRRPAPSSSTRGPSARSRP